jgi:hypothetical protein
MGIFDFLQQDNRKQEDETLNVGGVKMIRHVLKDTIDAPQNIKANPGDWSPADVRKDFKLGREINEEFLVPWEYMGVWYFWVNEVTGPEAAGPFDTKEQALVEAEMLDLPKIVTE